MAGEPKQFVVYKDEAGQWRWNLRAPNNLKIADSAESYVRKADCIHGARLVAGIAANAGIWNGTEQKWEN